MVNPITYIARGPQIDTGEHVWYHEINSLSIPYKSFKERFSSLSKLSAFSDVKAKGKRIYNSGQYTIYRSNQYSVLADVQGDNGSYTVYVNAKARVNKYDKNTFSVWNCTCKWAEWAFNRETYSGRMCSHVYAMYLVLTERKRKKSSMDEHDAKSTPSDLDILTYNKLLELVSDNIDAYSAFVQFGFATDDVSDKLSELISEYDIDPSEIKQKVQEVIAQIYAQQSEQIAIATEEVVQSQDDLAKQKVELRGEIEQEIARLNVQLQDLQLQAIENNVKEDAVKNAVAKIASMSYGEATSFAEDIVKEFDRDSIEFFVNNIDKENEVSDFIYALDLTTEDDFKIEDILAGYVDGNASFKTASSKTSASANNQEDAVESVLSDFSANELWEFVNGRSNPSQNQAVRDTIYSFYDFSEEEVEDILNDIEGKLIRESKMKPRDIVAAIAKQANEEDIRDICQDIRDNLDEDKIINFLSGTNIAAVNDFLQEYDIQLDHENMMNLRHCLAERMLGKESSRKQSSEYDDDTLLKTIEFFNAMADKGDFNDSSASDYQKAFSELIDRGYSPKELLNKKAKRKTAKKTAGRIFTEEEKLSLINELGSARQFLAGEIKRS